MFFNLSLEPFGSANDTYFDRNLTDIGSGGDPVPREGVFRTAIIVPLYVIIFLLSITGNVLVLVTLGHKRTLGANVTNAYLVNLAVSDLLLGVFCMPFTLIGQILRNFVFGTIMCRLIPYFQAVSVSVGVWTLVAISLERFFAICRPLESRTWQTQFHACKMILAVWMVSLMFTSPILVVSRLIPLRGGRHKCREAWPDEASERAFNIFLDIALLLVPITIMTMAYLLIIIRLWRGLRCEVKLSRGTESRCQLQSVLRGRGSRNAASGRRSWFRTCLQKIGLVARDESVSSSEIALPVLHPSPRSNEGQQNQMTPRTAASTTDEYTGQAIRSNYMQKSIDAKRKVIRMLFVVVAEFFICWTPLHVLNTWYLFAPDDVLDYVGANGISLIQLLAYISACCNPITYCFMNKNFRQAFFSVFTFCQPCAERCGDEAFVQRPRTELETLEAEDQV